MKKLFLISGCLFFFLLNPELKANNDSSKNNSKQPNFIDKLLNF